MDDNLEVWQVLRNDDYLRQFVHNAEKSQESRNVSIKSETTVPIFAVTEQLAKLTEGIQLLDKELQRQVLENHEGLVTQATWVEKLEAVLAVMHLHVQSLLSSVEHLLMKVVEPFNKLETQTTILARLHATSDLLHRVIRTQQLARRLPDMEILKAATLISELGELNRDTELFGLEILEGDHRLIRKETSRVEQQAQNILCQGLQTLHHQHVATGVEVLRNLGILEREMGCVLERALYQIKQNAERALDLQHLIPQSTSDRNPRPKGGPGRVTGSMYPGNIPAFRSKLWAAWEHVLTATVFTHCAQLSLLQSILSKRQGDVPSAPMDDESGGDRSSDIVLLFWSQVDQMLAQRLSSAAKESSYLQQALEGEYPKLLRLHLDLHKKLKTIKQPDTSSKKLYFDVGGCCRQFENAYLSRSVKLLLESVREMFPEGDPPAPPPTTDRVDNLVKTISSELSVSLVDEALSRPVARNIGKAVHLFCQKGEQMLAVGGDASQVIESPTAGQLLNISVGNITIYLVSQVQRVLSNMAAGLSKSVITEITKSLAVADHLTLQILSPLLASIADAIEAIVLSMHREDFDIKEGSNSSSLYMRELQGFISRAASTYLAPFNHQQLVTQSCTDVAVRAIELFVRHASLVRPISDAGRKKLANDFKTMEDAVSPLCRQLSSLGSSYSLLRSVRPLVLETTDQVAACPVLGQVIPYSLAITLLFSKGPSELLSPHNSVNWSVVKLSVWLDSHKSERERLELISGTLQRYQQTVRQQNQPAFHPVYPIMMALLERGLQYESSAS